MGIYISGVKGLPEQVQENKNKIKEVEEQIEGIDFEAVRQLQGQVVENTQDINNLEASIGVQNQAINTLNNDVDALESKTQKITYDEDADEIHIASDVIMEEDLDVDNVHVAGNGTFQNANGSGLHFQEGVNDDEVVLVNKESGSAHDLTLHADGTLTLDGNPVGKQYYQHHITWSSGGSYGAEIVFDIINDDPTPFTPITFCAYLDAKGINSEATGLKMNNAVLNAITNTVLLLNLFYRLNNYTVRVRARSAADAAVVNLSVDTTGVFKDTIL